MMMMMKMSINQNPKVVRCYKNVNITIQNHVFKEEYDIISSNNWSHRFVYIINVVISSFVILVISQLPMNAKVAEHLVQNLKESSDIQEIAQSANKHGTDVSEPRIREFEIEVERLQSKIDHLKSQNDLTCLSLGESKAHCDRLTVLIGKYESNNTAMQLALNYCDQALEAYQVLVSLLDSENSLLLTKCRAAGLGNYGK